LRTQGGLRLWSSTAAYMLQADAHKSAGRTPMTRAHTHAHTTHTTHTQRRTRASAGCAPMTKRASVFACVCGMLPANTHKSAGRAPMTLHEHACVCMACSQPLHTGAGRAPMTLRTCAHVCARQVCGARDWLHVQHGVQQEDRHLWLCIQKGHRGHARDACHRRVQRPGPRQRQGGPGCGAPSVCCVCARVCVCLCCCAVCVCCVCRVCAVCAMCV